MRVLVETDKEHIHEGLKADPRGRVTLGSEYADEEVDVAVVDSDGAVVEMLSGRRSAGESDEQ